MKSCPTNQPAVIGRRGGIYTTNGYRRNYCSPSSTTRLVSEEEPTISSNARGCAVICNPTFSISSRSRSQSPSNQRNKSRYVTPGTGVGCATVCRSPRGPQFPMRPISPAPSSSQMVEIPSRNPVPPLRRYPMRPITPPPISSRRVEIPPRGPVSPLRSANLENVPIDVLKSIVIKDLSKEDLLSLCRTSVRYRRICEDPRVWKYLIERDFKIDTDLLGQRPSARLYDFIDFFIRSDLIVEYLLDPNTGPVLNRVLEGPDLLPLLDKTVRDGSEVHLEDENPYVSLFIIPKNKLEIEYLPDRSYRLEFEYDTPSGLVFLITILTGSVSTSKISEIVKTFYQSLKEVPSEEDLIPESPEITPTEVRTNVITAAVTVVAPLIEQYSLEPSISQPLTWVGNEGSDIKEIEVRSFY